MRNVKLFLLGFTFVFFISCNSEVYEFITTRGAPSKKLSIIENKIYPLNFSVSRENHVYFAFRNTKGGAICSVDLNTGNITQITEDGNSDFSPLVSHDGNTVLFQRGSIFGGANTFFLVNSDGTNCRELADTLKNYYLSHAAFSLDDGIIYFVGGAIFDSSKKYIRKYPYCNDIFAINVDGKGFRRITHECITSRISDLIVHSNNHQLIVSIVGESFDNQSYYYIQNNFNILKRKPYPSTEALIDINTGIIERFDWDIDYYLNCYDNKIKKNTLVKYNIGLDKSTLYPLNKFALVQTYDGIFKLDIVNKQGLILIDSINNIPFNSLPDSLRIYNIELMYNQEKIIGGVGNENNYKLVILDIHKRKIEKTILMDLSKVIPTYKRTLNGFIR